VEAGAPAALAAREDVRVVQQAVEQGGDGGGIAEERSRYLRRRASPGSGGRPRRRST